MKNNKLLKILWGVVLAIFVVCIVFLGYSYFAGGDSKKSEKSSAQTSNKKQDKNTDEEKYKSQNSQNTQEKQESGNIVGSRGANNQASNKNNYVGTKEYNGKKVSHNEGVGTTGKVFKTQSEALEFGNKEIERLVKEDKKPRQFSISKVTAEDGTLLGWTVDIFEDTSAKKDN